MEVVLTVIYRSNRIGRRFLPIIGRGFIVGSTGNLPVPVGNLPTGISIIQKLAGKLPDRTGW